MSDEALIADARAAIESGNAGEIRARFSKLEHLVRPEAAVEVLGEALACPVWTTRRQAADQLVQIGAPALAHITGLLKQENIHQVYWGCYVLAQIERKGAPTLRSVLTSPRRDFRLCALHALARRTSFDAVEMLIHALDDPVWTHRKQAADTLVAREDREEVAERVRQELVRGNRNRTYWGIQVLNQILGARTLPILMKLLPWEDDDLRYQVLVTLSRLRVEGVISLLLEYLADRSPLVRRRVVDLLIELGPDAVPPVMPLLESKYPDTRLAAYKVLARLAPEVFQQRCRTDFVGAAPKIKYVILEALGFAASRDALSLLIWAFQDPLWVIRKSASEQIAIHFKDAAIPDLVAGMQSENEDVQYWSVTTLGRIGSPALPHLVQAVQCGDRNSRSFAIAALADSDPPVEFFTILQQVFQDEHWPLRRQAAQCVHAMGLPVVPLLLRSAFSGVEHVRFWSRKVLVSLSGRHTSAFLERLERLPETERNDALGVLERVEPVRLVQLLRLKIDDAVVSARGWLEDPNQIHNFPPAEPEPIPLAEPVGVIEAVVTPGSAPEAPAARPEPRPAITEERAVNQSLTGRLRRSRKIQVPRQDPTALLTSLVQQVMEAGGLEVHLKVGSPPTMKDLNQLAELSETPLTVPTMEGVVQTILGPRRKLPDDSAILDVGFDLETAGRCRAKIFRDNRGITVVLRPLGHSPPRLSDIGADGVLESLPELTSGLVLISGGALSGKSWTALALLEAINSTRPVQIVTVESPVEHVQFPRSGFVTQKEVPLELPNMLAGLRFACSCGARVIYLGEIPDGETALLALEEAAAGALVIATVRAQSAVWAIKQVVDLAGSNAPRALSLMASALKVSIRQTLLAGVDPRSRVAAREVVGVNAIVRNMLEHGQFDELEKSLNGDTLGEDSQSMEAAMKGLVQRGLIAAPLTNT
jgi:twitching motility protein PilT